MKVNDNKIIKLFAIIIFSVVFLIKFNDITKNWIKYENNPVLGNSEIGIVFDPFVFKNENIFKMYVSWRTKGVIALSTSKDGIIWSDLNIVLNKGNSSSWESIVNRASIVNFNKKFYLWYTGQHNGISKIGLAISDDGYNFVKYENNPVLIPQYNYEKQSVMNPHVIYDPEERIFKMWYSAGETYEPDVVCYATSDDGKHWKKNEKNPIFKPNIDKSSLDNYKIGGCDVHKISNKKYLMFYIGYTDINTARIFVAKSKNGINNWKRNNNPIIQPTKGKFDSEACYKPSVVFDSYFDKWLIWYNGRTKSIEYIGVATHYKFQFLILLNIFK